MKCPNCGAAELAHDTRNMPYTYKGEKTSIPAVTGDYCPAFYLRSAFAFAAIVALFRLPSSTFRMCETLTPQWSANSFCSIPALRRARAMAVRRGLILIPFSWRREYGH